MILIKSSKNARHEGVASARAKRKGCLEMNMLATSHTSPAQEHDRSPMTKKPLDHLFGLLQRGCEYNENNDCD